MSEWFDQTQDRGESYTIRASFITKNTEDWSQLAVLRDANNGKIITPNPGDLATFTAMKYQYKCITGDRITYAGLYPTADYATVFGQ